MERGGETYYYHFDGLGSVTNLTDSSGATVESYSYNAFGLPSTVSSVGNPYLFTGRRYDEETDLYYYRARYYSPSIGRFLQKDPITWTPDDPRIFNLASVNNRLLILLPSFRSAILPNGLSLSLWQSFSHVISAIGQNNPLFFHPYLYCFNNPISYVDPFGLLIIPGLTPPGHPIMIQRDREYAVDPSGIHLVQMYRLLERLERQLAELGPKERNKGFGKALKRNIKRLRRYLRFHEDWSEIYREAGPPGEILR